MKKTKKMIMLVSVAALLFALAPGAQGGIVSGLKAHWMFEETSGSTTFDVHGGYDGDFVSGVLLGEPGKFGNAYQLSGGVSGSQINLPHDVGGQLLVPLSDPWSFSAWIKKGSQDSDGAIFSNDAYDTNRLNLSVAGSGALYVYHHGTSPLATYHSGGSVDDDEWHHVAVTRDGLSEWTLWLDGVAEDRGPFDVPVPDGGWRIGQNGYGNQPYDGLIDDAAVWDRALNATEIAWLWNDGAGNAVIPEPASGVLVVLGLGAVAAYRRRRA